MPYPLTTPPPPPGGWPRISVVVPSFNQARFLGDTLASILSQGYPDLECIVVDGGSTDGSVDIIRAASDRLAWWCSEKDGGHADALNKGFSRATGEILCWLNSDDLMAPWCLHTIGDVFARKPEIEWLTGECGVWDACGRLVSAYPGGASATDYLLLNNFHIQQESTFWRKSLWVRAGAKIDGSYRLMIDSELWLRFFRHAVLHSLGTVVSGYRYHGANRALTHSRQVQEERWRAVAAHVAPLSWRTRLVHAMGPDQYGKGKGILDASRRRLLRQARKWLLPRKKIPCVVWDAESTGWTTVSRRLYR